MLDAEAVGHLVEGHVPEEGVELQVLVVFGCEYQLTDGEEDLVELGLHRVAQLETAGALHGVYALVVGQVDGDGLAAGVAVSGVVDYVIDVEVGGSGLQGSSFCRAGSMATNLARSLLRSVSFSRINAS